MLQSAVTDEYVKSTMLRRFGITVKRTGRQHWNGPCPRCGGKDRLFVQKSGYIKCNQCAYTDWINSDMQLSKEDVYEIMRQAEINKRKEKAEMERTFKAWREGFIAGCFWRKWHDRMSQDNVDWWLSRGITNKQIAYYELGYIPNKIVNTDDGLKEFPAYTIPVRDAKGWKICDMHYRLVLSPGEEQTVKKYRYQSGIPAVEFYATPKVHKTAIVVEGAIKDMVVYRFIAGKAQVVGLPSCNPKEDVIRRLSVFDDVILMLDPGCEQHAKHFKDIVPQTRICNLPGKPDDLIQAGMTMKEFKSYIPRRIQ